MELKPKLNVVISSQLCHKVLPNFMFFFPVLCCGLHWISLDQANYNWSHPRTLSCRKPQNLYEISIRLTIPQIHSLGSYWNDIITLWSHICICKYVRQLPDVTRRKSLIQKLIGRFKIALGHSWILTKAIKSPHLVETEIETKTELQSTSV